MQNTEENKTRFLEDMQFLDAVKEVCKKYNRGIGSLDIEVDRVTGEPMKGPAESWKEGSYQNRPIMNVYIPGVDDSNGLNVNYIDSEEYEVHSMTEYTKDGGMEFQVFDNAKA
jgi:hypothetical protein